ncbi:HGxxPAAW family protein [Streptomyces sp. NBC_01497]|uniref:HGxxPAAW family protein n=1 Tax=Streptomyces sp. NBC_01497 TaxID=2903885 RepID=UPI002E3631EF|nr:HGxxPAAW family protein [Streptomyces sp. NBC_01497]
MAGSSHGHTPAAWTGVTISFVGFCAGGVFMVGDSPVGFWVSMGVVILGLVAGVVMRLMGLGMPKESDEMVQAREAAGRAQATSRTSAAEAKQHARA